MSSIFIGLILFKSRLDSIIIIIFYIIIYFLIGLMMFLR
jgi:hypothetical protein